MISTPNPTRWEFSKDVGRTHSPWLRADVRALAELVEGKPSATNSTEPTAISPTKPSTDAKIRPAVLKDKQPSLRRPTARSMIIFCMGVTATLAWQSHGDAIREMIANSYPQLGWLAPQTAAASPEMISPNAPANTSDALELKSILVNVAAMRQSVDQLAAQFVASQQQMASDIAKLNDKISSAPPPRPAAAPARKPVPVPPQSPQEPPMH